nr:unnamed protein product [Callosobruchus analis]
MSQLEVIIKDNDIQIFCVTERWLTEKSCFEAAAGTAGALFFDRIFCFTSSVVKGAPVLRMTLEEALDDSMDVVDSKLGDLDTAIKTKEQIEQTTNALPFIKRCVTPVSSWNAELDRSEMCQTFLIREAYRRFAYSTYKHFNTVKGLVGVAPNGALTVISEPYPGSVSDKKIVHDFAVLNKMALGDPILADANHTTPPIRSYSKYNMVSYEDLMRRCNFGFMDVDR